MRWLESINVFSGFKGDYMRKSIFEIVSESLDMENETYRLLTMAVSEETLCVSSFKHYTLFDFVDEYCFRKWECRGHFISVEDFLEALDWAVLQNEATYDTEALMTCIELIYNFWNLSNCEMFNSETHYSLHWCGNYYHLKDVMDDILGQYNHCAYIDKKKKCVLVIEDKPEVTAVAEIVPATLALSVIKYNHKSLKGEIELKKSILISMGAELEPKRKELQEIDRQLSEDIFFMLNNVNIRHNNRSKKDKGKYKEYTAKMTKDQMEKWYDELYQMMLLAILLLDNTSRAERVKTLKDKIVNGQACEK